MDAQWGVARGAEAPPDTGGRAVGPVPGGLAVSPLPYLALGALAVAVIFGLSTDVRAAIRRMFHQRRQSPASVRRVPGSDDQVASPDGDSARLSRGP